MLRKLFLWYLYIHAGIFGYFVVLWLWDGFKASGWAFFDLGLSWEQDATWIFGLSIGFVGCFALLKLSMWLYKHDPSYRKNADEDYARQQAKDRANRWK